VCIADCVAAIMSVWLSLPVWYGDRDFFIESRIALYRPVAVAICRATENPDQRAFLGSQAYWETRLASHVLEERCHEGPPGARCDGGRSIGPWQPRRRWCPAAWDMSLNRDERYLAGARCAHNLWRHGVVRCGTSEGGFVAQGGSRECRRPWARARVPLWSRLRRAISAGGADEEDEVGYARRMVE
jgi:hypothetical protein